MSVVPINPLSEAEERLQITLADCPTFRTLTGTADRAAARAHIYSQALPAPAAGAEYTLAELAALRPCATTYTSMEEGYTAEVDAHGDVNEFRDRGELLVLLECVVDPAQGYADQDRTWLNVVGGIIAELCRRAGGDEYLNITLVQLREYGRATEQRLGTEGEYVYAVLVVQWVTG